jgi:hypothetical protein
MYIPYITNEEMEEHGPALGRINEWISSPEFRSRCHRGKLILMYFRQFLNMLCSGNPNHESSIQEAKNYYKEKQDE